MMAPMQSRGCEKCGFMALGEPDEALDCLEAAYQDRDTYLVWLKIRPVFDSIRSDSRFGQRCDKIGLPE